MVVLHEVENDINFPWPSLIVNRDVANGGDADFIRPGANYVGARSLGVKMGAVGDTVYVVSNEGPAFSVVYAVGADSAFVETRVESQDEFWSGSYTAHQRVRRQRPATSAQRQGTPASSSTAGAASRLDYHNGVSGYVIPVDEE